MTYFDDVLLKKCQKLIASNIHVILLLQYLNNFCKYYLYHRKPFNFDYQHHIMFCQNYLFLLLFFQKSTNAYLIIILVQRDRPPSLN